MQNPYEPTDELNLYDMLVPLRAYWWLAAGIMGIFVLFTLAQTYWQPTTYESTATISVNIEAIKPATVAGIAKSIGADTRIEGQLVHITATGPTKEAATQRLELLVNGTANGITGMRPDYQTRLATERAALDELKASFTPGPDADSLIDAAKLEDMVFTIRDLEAESLRQVVSLVVITDPAKTGNTQAMMVTLLLGFVAALGMVYVVNAYRQGMNKTNGTT